MQNQIFKLIMSSDLVSWGPICATFGPVIITITIDKELDICFLPHLLQQRRYLFITLEAMFAEQCLKFDNEFPWQPPCKISEMCRLDNIRGNAMAQDVLQLADSIN